MATSTPVSVPDKRHEDPVIILNGDSLTLEDLVLLGQMPPVCRVAISDEVARLVTEGRAMLEAMSANETIYGVNTGFGSLARVKIPPSDVEQLQLNLIRTHAAGVGEPVPHNISRMVFALRLNTLSKGHSGCTLETLQRMVSAFNAGCVPRIPCQGTVGASGDLAPLAHLALSLIGEGEMWDDATNTWIAAKEVLERKGCSPIHLHSKEGLAMTNGTPFITSICTQALLEAEKTLEQAVIVAALSLEAAGGTDKCFDARIHGVRKHSGQQWVAEYMRSLLTSGPTQEHSTIHEALAKTKVQDSYTLRCVPQVYGVTRDMLKWVRGILSVEINSVTDNPLVFLPDTVLSGGNFHAEYPAKAADMLAIAIQDVANMSERRIFKLTTGSLSNGLPACLATSPGVTSGCMIVQYTAAAVTSENKVLVHPSSSDTIPTGEGIEDHVSMGGYSARKAIQVVDNVQKVVGIELLTACQALAYRHRDGITSTPVLEAVYNHVRHTRGVPSMVDGDHYISPDMATCIDVIKKGELLPIVKQFIGTL
ncbi:histidine ammonia-lyase [Pelomyxa schiedti]|nr:histidine ammonia-lyase [Pelomyxa schiedti]